MTTTNKTMDFPKMSAFGQEMAIQTANNATADCLATLREIRDAGSVDAAVATALAEHLEFHARGLRKVASLSDRASMTVAEIQAAAKERQD